MKIRCPFHDDTNPSMELYHDGGYCFVCGRAATLAELGRTRRKLSVPRPKEDVAAEVARIRALPVKQIRGLELPYDETGYYILWPDGDYYKKRFFAPDADPRYRCPSGTRQPLLYTPGTSLWTAYVEGEINALSVHQAIEDLSVLCPGGTNQFSAIPAVALKDKCLIIVDSDKAGIAAYISLASRIYTERPGAVVKKLLMSEDANEVLLKHGKERLREVINKAING